MNEGKRKGIYESLVRDENDTLGQIAYSLYKRQKIEFIKKQSPTEQQIKDFQEMAGSDSQLDLYRTKAVQLIQVFLEAILREDIEKQKKEFLERYTPHTFGSGILQSLLASLIFVVLGIALFYGAGGWARLGSLLIELSKL
jgi:hypothetical protein